MKKIISSLTIAFFIFSFLQFPGNHIFPNFWPNTFAGDWAMFRAKRDFCTQNLKMSMPSSGPSWILAQKFLPDWFFSAQWAKNTLFSLNRFDWVEPSCHIWTHHSHTFFFMSLCAIHQSWLHALSFPHLYMQHYTWCVQSVGKHSTERRHNNQQVGYNTTQQNSNTTINNNGTIPFQISNSISNQLDV